MSGLLEDQFMRCFKFDHSYNRLYVGTKSGLRSVNCSRPLDFTCSSRLDYVKIMHFEVIPKNGTVMYVTESARKKLLFYSLYNSTDLDPLDPKHYSRCIVRIKATNERVIVAVEDTIFIYSSVWKDMKLLNQIDLSGQLSENIVDLSEHPVNSYVAYPNFDRLGQLIIADSSAPEKKMFISAHDNPIVALTFDPNGRSVASASEHGILIKVNRTFNGECIYEFKRGVTLNISITSLSFSQDAKFLCVNDSTDICKIYKLDYSASVVTAGSSWFRETFQRVAELILPENASKMLFHEDPFARAKLPENSAWKAISIMYKDESGQHHLLVVSTDGLIYTYSIDSVNGGQCELLKSFSIEDNRYVENAADTWIML